MDNTIMSMERVKRIVSLQEEVDHKIPGQQLMSILDLKQPPIGIPLHVLGPMATERTTRPYVHEVIQSRVKKLIREMAKDLMLAYTEAAILNEKEPLIKVLPNTIKTTRQAGELLIKNMYLTPKVVGASDSNLHQGPWKMKAVRKRVTGRIRKYINTILIASKDMENMESILRWNQKLVIIFCTLAHLEKFDESIETSTETILSE